MRRVAVTGAGGFIGSALVRRLARMDMTTSALLGPPSAEVTPPPPGVRALAGEIDRPGDVASLVAGSDIVFHVAGPASVAASFDRPVEFARVHVCGTANVLDACRRAGVRRLVHVSSAEVYGHPRTHPVSEDHPLEARSPYAAAKLGAERMVEAYHLTAGLEAAVLRPFSVYGPRQSRGGVVSAVVEQALRGDAIELHDPTAVRDFCFVEDVVDAILAAAAAPIAALAVYNVASGAGTSIGELARVAARAAGRILPIRTRGGDRPARATIPALVADTRRAASELGWRPRMPLAEGLRVTVDWYREREGAA